jgi:3-oxoacyl-[acyl-carrier protein] reductase
VTTVEPTPNPADAVSFHGARVLVVGGSSGIGNGIARTFAAAGADVTVTGTRPSAADYGEVAGAHLDGLAYVRADVSDEASIAGLPWADRLDVLVYSAGTVAYGRAEYDPAVFARVLEVNLTGALRVSTRYHDALAACAGSIVFVASTSSVIATPGQPGYGASKGGLVTLTKSLADAWARDGIRVNALAPGLVATRLTEVTRSRDAAYDASLAQIPLRRWGTPEEMGGVAVFLASPLASYVTGQVLLVDGGRTLR